ncbi:MAG TPA: hypothetical protein VLH58_02530 [Candidatus Methylomirabilis sp.]|nr:hypothetical protein [Candidatus Methylomirabilis sp.]HSC70199.1 hypothetical protein [Candidatus Methylomirabilis sp.]
MRRMLMSGAIVAVLVGVILVAGTALAQEKPVATLTFSGGSVSVGIGYSWGSGTLTYQGKDYAFSVEGLSVGVVGGSSVTASGDVYNLKKLEDFGGTYKAAGAQATLYAGKGATALENQAKVVIKLVSTTQGAEFKFAAGGVKLTLKK